VDNQWQLELPPLSSHVKMVCMTKLKCGQYATAWATTAVVEPTGAVTESELVAHRRHRWRRAAKVVVTGAANLRPYVPVRPASPSVPWFSFKSTHDPQTFQNVENGCAQLGYLSPALPADCDIATLWCACCALAGIVANYDGVTPMDDDTADMMLAVSLRSIYPKYVTERDIDGKEYDVRDPLGMSMLTNNDCDGAAILVCQFYNNVRALLPAQIAAADASDVVKAIATRLAQRAHAYESRAALVFGMAKSPSKGPDSASFGHAFVALISIDPTKPNLHIEATAPLVVDRAGAWPPPGFGRVYPAGKYPESIKGIDARGVRAFEQWMYCEAWVAISTDYSRLFEKYPPWNEQHKWDTSAAVTKSAERPGVELRLYPTLALCSDDDTTASLVRAEHITDFSQFNRAIGVTWLLGGDCAKAKTTWVVQCGPFVAVELHTAPPEE